MNDKSEVIGCYTLDLYCRCANNSTMSIPGIDRRDCIKQAKDRGWKVDFANRTCLCPICSKVKPKPPTGLDAHPTLSLNDIMNEIDKEKS